MPKYNRNEPIREDSNHDGMDHFTPKPPTSLLGNGVINRALTRWWLILIFAVLGCAAMFYKSSLEMEVYQATTLLEMQSKQRQIIGQQLESDRIAPQMLLSNVASKLTSPALLQKVAESEEIQQLERLIPPTPSLVPRYWRDEAELTFRPASDAKIPQLVNMLSGWIAIGSQPNTTIIEVLVTHPDEECATVIADAILRIFLDQERIRKSGGVSTAFRTIREEADRARENLDLAQKSLQVYVSAIKLNEQIQEARAELLALKQRYKSKHPKLIQHLTLYTDLNKRFRREIERAMTAETEKGYWSQYSKPLGELENQINDEEDALSEASDEWLAMAQNALSTRANLLNARISQGQNLYDKLTERLTELDVGSENDSQQYTIAQSAYTGQKTVLLRYEDLTLGGLLGASLGFGIALLLAKIDFKIYDVRSFEELTGLNCMAAIPSHKHFTEREDSEWKPILEVDNFSVHAESIRILRAAIVLLGQKRRHQIILITSAIPREGKTTISSELSAAFALSNEKTLLMGFDLRKPRLHHMFPKLKDARGLSEILAGQAEFKDCVISDQIENLDILGPGGKAINPSELLHEEELRKLFAQATEKYDRIIIDCAPVLSVSDSRILAGFAHTVVLVARSNKTPAGATLRAIDLLSAAGKTPAGFVLNGIKESSSGGYYGYKGYGEYGSKYAYGKD